MELSGRKKKILAAVVEEYIRTAEPVGSKTVAQTAELGCSSATIRNELAELASMGYLEQPHTSAGRVPTPQGYRMYVNELMQRQKLSLEETEEINRSLNDKLRELDKLVSNVGALASSLTNYPAMAIAAPPPATIKRFDLIYIDANTFIIVAMMSNNSVKNKLVRLPVSVGQDMIQRLSSVFNAKNAAGYSVNIRYDSKGDSIMAIYVFAPDDSSTSGTSGNGATQNNGDSGSGDASTGSSSDADFKAAMDSYESLMNEYADFMEKYNAGGHPASMAADYAKIMVKYNDAMKKLDAIDENSLTPEEQQYYIEVQTRVNQRLASVGASTAQ